MNKGSQACVFFFRRLLLWRDDKSVVEGQRPLGSRAKHEGTERTLFAFDDVEERSATGLHVKLLERFEFVCVGMISNH